MTTACGIRPATDPGRWRLKRAEVAGVLCGRADEMEPAARGPWSIEKWEVGEHDEQMGVLRSAISSSSRGRFAPAGTYTALTRGGATVMSDTVDELLDLAEFAERARGRVLINGLGLGCALRIALAYDDPGVNAYVEHIDVVELDGDVLALVSPYFADDRVTFHHDDAYKIKWPPRTRWDVVWHDVWDDIDSDNDFATLHRRYGGRCGWQGSWCRAEAEEAARRWQRENGWWLARLGTAS